MNGQEFIDTFHQRKHGTSKVKKDEVPMPYLLTESGAFFLIDTEHEVDRLREAGITGVVYMNQTTTSIRLKQAEVIRNRDE